MYPKTKSGILSNNKNFDNEHQSGVIRDSSIAVPKIPLSYNFTVERNTVTPKAFTSPAIVSIIIFLNLILRIKPLSFYDIIGHLTIRDKRFRCKHFSIIARHKV